jgi:CRISPR/Cas system CSM-associated protein Csm5 (group 7 of RAMP superfamily)
MKTYPIQILRKAFFQLVDNNKFVHFTLFNAKRGKPFKVKAKISNLYASNQGLSIHFSNVYVNRKRFFNIYPLVKDIRWKETPFNEEVLQQICEYIKIKNLTSSSDKRLAGSLSETASQLNRSDLELDI